MIQDECRGTKVDLTKEVASMQATLLDTLSQQSASDSMERSNITGMLGEIQTLVADIPIRHRVLRQLVFESIESRWNQIPDAEPITCQWILDEGFENGAYSPYNWYGAWQDTEDANYRFYTRQSFLHWLRAGEGIFHISGNAGSGKSTLVKFIGRQEKTRQELEIWAAGKELVFGEFYFWTAGATAQRTLPGLYRSILFQVLGQCPALIEKVFPAQLRAMKASRGDTLVERAQSFTDKHIQEAFDLLLQHTSGGTYKVFLIIDGLDEYEGNRLDHEALAKKLKGWTANGNVKIMVSSRPWPEFLGVLACDTHSTIHLHTLNRCDIRTYCLWRFQSDCEARNVPELYHRLARAVVEHSQGVFLWAHLVVENLLQGIRQCDPPEVLEAKVLEAPSDIEALYDKLREPIVKSEIDMIQSNRILLLAARNPFDTDLSGMAFSWLEDGPQSGLLDPDFPSVEIHQPYTEKEIAQRLYRVEVRVNNLARGLLQIVWPMKTPYDDSRLPPNFHAAKVQFCHRTARDYLLRNQRRYQQLLESFPGFEETDPYGRICLADLIFEGDFYGKRNLDNMRHRLSPSLCLDFDPKTFRKFEVVLNSTIEPNWMYTLLRGEVETRRRMPKDLEGHRVSFVQHAAYFGYDRFVLSQLDERSPEELSSRGSSILVAGMLGNSDTLGRHLLERRVGMDILVRTYPGKGQPALEWPAWVILTAKFVSQAFHDLSRLSTLDTISNWEDMLTIVREDMLPILRVMHQHSVEVGQPLGITLQASLVSAVPYTDPTMDIKHSIPSLCTSTLLRFFECLLESGGRPEHADDMTGEGQVFQFIHDWLFGDEIVHIEGKERAVRVTAIDFASQRLEQDLLDEYKSYPDISVIKCY